MPNEINQNEITRRASLTVSASQAASAALQKHSQTPNIPQIRTNSLRNQGRTQSMRAYTYTPSASYQTGKQLFRASSLRSNIPSQSLPLPTTGRTSSLRANSLRASSLRANSLLRNSTQNHSNNDFQLRSSSEDTEGILSSKTVTHVDQFGEVQSVTTEIVRQLPDGSNIIEKTTNYSRPSSRCNSSKFTPNSPLDTEGYNMSRIDEELNDFAYSYLDDSPIPNANVYEKSAPKIEHEGIGENSNRNRQIPLERVLDSTSEHEPIRLKSILKKNSQTFSSQEEFSDAKADLNGSPSDKLSTSDENGIKYSETTSKVHRTPVVETHDNNRHSLIKSLATRIKFAPSSSDEEDKHEATEFTDRRSGPHSSKEQPESDDKILRSNYKYRNHHRGFRSHSLRSSGPSQAELTKKSTTSTQSPAVTELQQIGVSKSHDIDPTIAPLQDIEAGKHLKGPTPTIDSLPSETLDFGQNSTHDRRKEDQLKTSTNVIGENSSLARNESESLSAVEFHTGIEDTNTVQRKSKQEEINSQNTVSNRLDNSQTQKKDVDRKMARWKAFIKKYMISSR
ncbi:hypothetical protein PUMCH_003575 [Australozyma saopauloensis]|uniref:Uncharacterized protein n=1 Tax=Australozyma saopauloensis TaxID=291208 RepID=A0AAX4HCT3_9ASCO|nr:hypothetical protein PUMCH_003575 [[Candida] saopauloensis]